MFWGGKMTGAVIVFFANRYFTLAANIFLLCYDVIVFPQSAEKVGHDDIVSLYPANVPSKLLVHDL